MTAVSIAIWTCLFFVILAILFSFDLMTTSTPPHPNFTSFINQQESLQLLVAARLFKVRVCNSTDRIIIEYYIITQVKIKMISNKKCNAIWRLSGDACDGCILPSQVCVHDDSPPKGQRPSVCKGDSGGPMMCWSDHSILNGVTSWGQTGCYGDLPSVYTRVSSYIPWIVENISGLQLHQDVAHAGF